MEIKAGNPFKTIRVRPSANLERLEEVIVLLTLAAAGTETDDAEGVE